jgi:hypothetical protein
MIRKGLSCHLQPRPVFSAVIHLPCLTLENSLSFYSRLHAPAMHAQFFRLSVSCDMTTATGGFLVLVLAKGQKPPSIRVGRLWPHAPDSVCVVDALGKPGRETNPSFSAASRTRARGHLGRFSSPVHHAFIHDSLSHSPFACTQSIVVLAASLFTSD